MDEADRASEEEQRMLERQINAARGMYNQTNYDAPIITSNECVECGELIPSARQIALPGCQLCVDCAEILQHYERSGRYPHQSNEMY